MELEQLSNTPLSKSAKKGKKDPIPFREVFLAEATTCPTVAAQIVALIEERDNTACESIKRKCNKQLWKISDLHGGTMVNVEDSTLAQSKTNKRLIVVTINNCWSIKTGKPYKMTLTREEWYFFGKPIGKENNYHQRPLLVTPVATWRLK